MKSSCHAFIEHLTQIRLLQLHTFCGRPLIFFFSSLLLQDCVFDNYSRLWYMILSLVINCQKETLNTSQASLDIDSGCAYIYRSKMFSTQSFPFQHQIYFGPFHIHCIAWCKGHHGRGLHYIFQMLIIFHKKPNPQHLRVYLKLGSVIARKFYLMILTLSTCFHMHGD